LKAVSSQNHQSAFAKATADKNLDSRLRGNDPASPEGLRRAGEAAGKRRRSGDG